MAKKKIKPIRSLKTANVTAIFAVLFLGASFIFETFIYKPVNNGLAGFFILGFFIIIISIIRNTINLYKLAFNVPFVLQIYYSILMLLGGWHSPHYFIVCLALTGLSCIYFSFNRTVAYIIFQHLFILFLMFALKSPVAGIGAQPIALIINWAVLFFGGLLLLAVTRYATVVLDRSLENQTSFRNLLATTENIVAMINERNEIVYASKTLANLGSIEDSSLVQGRPIIDLFPGRSLKVYAGKMLKEKSDYKEDWEFSLNGQKRYFKTLAHSLSDGSGGTLISMYDMTHLAERDEIAAMKDSMKIGLFFMDRNCIIQDHYSRYLEEMLMEPNLFGRLFTDIIADSVNPSELEAIKDYFGMILDRTYDQEMLDDINPLTELHYVNSRTGDKKVFQCAFSTVERDKGEVFLLVTVYDITERVELQKRLEEEQARRQEEMQAVFELIQVEPDVFSDFMEDLEHEFSTIEGIQKDADISTREALVKIYQSVHAMKSNSVILGLNIYGNKLHDLESKIKDMREAENVPFSEMLNLAMDIEKISQEREGFKDIINKLQSYTGGTSGSASGGRQNIKVLVDSLAKATARAAEDMEKQILFESSDIDPEAIEKGPRRVMKEILLQLVRNSCVHGIEIPDERKAKGKKERGIIRLSIKISEDRQHIHIKISDDGKGLDYKKIAERAVKNKLIKKEDANSKDMLMKAIFAPGFSTADKEGVHGGRGIGLNLVRDRIKEVNGTIKLRSETDKGIVFFVSIPFAKNQQQPEKAAAK
jgi:two-component system chemotaxis sensor kinase CheA